MVAIGQAKALAPIAVGYQLVLRHLPDRPLFLERSAAERTKHRFEDELVALSTDRVRLVAACVIHARDERCCEIDALTLMMTSEQWIPLQHVAESDVVAKLVAEERAFIKPLPYDAREPGRSPNFLLLDAWVRPLALDIVGAFESDAERATRLAAIARREPKGWVWDTAHDAVVPDLPRKEFPHPA